MTPTPSNQAGGEPRPRRVIGILGGLGPFAHIALEQELLAAARELAGARADQHFPEWIVSSISRTPDRCTALAGSGPDPLPDLLRGLRRLEPGRTADGAAVDGADFVLVACNTAHAYLEAMRAATRLPILDMIELSAEELGTRLGAGSRIGLLATDGTLETGLYRSALERRGLRPLSPLDAPDGRRVQRDRVMAAIFGGAGIEDGLKSCGAGPRASHPSAAAVEALEEAATFLHETLRCDALVAACTEISFALPGPEIRGLPIFDPLTILAREAIRLAYSAE